MAMYARSTTVSVAKSKVEIEQMLGRYGADQFAYGWRNEAAMIGFRSHNRFVQFTLPFPDRMEKRFTHSAKYTWKRNTDAVAQQKYEQEQRSRWRALCLVIKAKLEAVESGITSFEQEFLAHIVIPGTGKTVWAAVAPRLEESYSSGKPVALLPEVAS